ncbi:MAG: spermine synthase [Fibrobacter sp.]|nr:spermine synthase [Fibrobacter sp.]
MNKTNTISAPFSERLIYPLFALSGISGLIYEGTWARYLKLFLGHSSYGQILTLCIYMGGLGIGSFIASRTLKYVKRPLRAYAITEFAIGISGLLYHNLYEFITEWFYNAAWSAQLTTQQAEVAKIVLSVITTTPTAIMLGLTFPWIAAGLMRRHRDDGQSSLPLLYFTNSLGAAGGLLFASYYLIPHLGTQGTLWFAALINITLGVFFVSIDRNLRKIPTEKFAEVLTPKPSPTPLFSNAPGERIWIWVAAITGLTSFVYEVVWIRLLSLMMGSSTHSFDQMISAFIFGIAIGSLVSKKLMRKDVLVFLALAQIFMGFFAICTVYFHTFFFEVMNTANLLFGETSQGYVGWSILKFLVAISWMVPTSFFAGMTMPFITYLASQFTKSEASVGKIYGWNTIGSIVGSVLSGLYLIPLLQLKWSLVSAAIVDVLLGAALLLIWRPQWRRKGLFWALTLAACFPVLLVDFDTYMVTAGVFRGHKEYHREEKVTVYNGRTATISFHESPVHYYVKTNGKPDASIRKDRTQPVEGDELTQAATALIPMGTRNEPYEAAMVGFGSGMSAHYLLADPLLQRLDVVEIEKEMLTLANKFRPINDRAFDDPRVNLYVDDARTFFHTHGKSYDVLVSVPSNPWVSGVSSLFSIEFYQHIQRYLKPGGTMVQWLQLYEFDNELMLHILQALHQSFEHVTLYSIPEEPDIVILASDQPLRQKYIDRFAKTPEIVEEFEKMHRPWWTFGEQNFLATTKSLEPLLKGVPANSEYVPWVDNRAEATRYTISTVGLTYALDSCEMCWPDFLEHENYAPRKAFKNWLKGTQAPDSYLRETVRHQLSLHQEYMSFPDSALLDTNLSDQAQSAITPTGREPSWSKFWRDFRKFMAQLPFDSTRSSVPEYALFKRMIAAQQVPLGISVEFEFLDHLCHERYAEAARMLPALREIFYLMSMDQIFLRNVALAAFMANDTRELRIIFDEAIIRSPYMDNAEKRLIASLLGKDAEAIPFNTPPDYY